jgi:prophage maintenance system killer protein
MTLLRTRANLTVATLEATLKERSSDREGTITTGMSTPFSTLARCTGLPSKAHACRDGNKQTSLLAIRAFLRANEADFDYGFHDEEEVEMMQDIAAGREDVAEWIARNNTGFPAPFLGWWER